MKVDTQKMYSYLDEFRILKTLGAGYHAQYILFYFRVKLAENEDGELFAIKRYKK